MTPSSRFILSGLCCAAVIAPSALGSHIAMNFAGRGLGQSITVRHELFISANNPEGQSRLSARQNLWDISTVGGNSPSATRHALFSAEIGAPASGEANIQSIIDAWSVEQGRGIGRAALVQNLYSTIHNATASNLHAAAFQVAIWEVVYENAFDPLANTFAAAGLDAANGVTNEGGFSIGDGRTGARDPVASLANQWLMQAWHNWYIGETGQPLSLAHSPGGTSQLLTPIPLPSAGGLALFGMMCVGGCRRRRA